MSEDNRTKWEIESLHKKTDKHEERLDEHDKRLTSFQSFKDSTVEKLITIFNSIEEMKEDSQWIRKTFTTTILGAIATVIASLLVWLITS
ncbi:hypothetical protein CIL05_06715 [Virgibacillus profundi]|uniref:Protein xhlA n=1 Tax=Virgibacillus profundi TaxID=2024555 RepID=A0A2A2IGD6_9BACI|nr:hypothetical protein [Virgibacillus profundi]PAV30153.1 hypothetical protein CIL05_06715 [Virgibacillus profundi]PXY54325.1 hypothetical protein CIT14_06800 [Virgibacillus profundi]